MSPFYNGDAQFRAFLFDTDGVEDEGAITYTVVVKNALYFRRAFFSSIGLLTDVNNWQATNDNASADIASIYGSAAYASIQEYVPDVINYPRQAEFFYDSVEITQGGSLNTIVERNQWYGTFSYQLNAAINDSWTRDVFLAAGNYTMTVYYSKNTYGGIVTLYVNGASVGTLNTYNSVSLMAQKATFSMNVAVSGRVTISGSVLSKQAQSTGYRIDCTKITIN